jgi:hypothetical protein
MVIEPNKKNNSLKRMQHQDKETIDDHYFNGITLNITPLFNENRRLLLSIRPTIQTQFRQLNLSTQLQQEVISNQAVSPYIQEPARAFELKNQQLLLIGFDNSSKIDSNDDTTLIINNNSHLNNSEIVVLLQARIDDKRARPWGSAIK